MTGRFHTTAVAVLFILISYVSIQERLVHAHQSVSFPYPISRDVACRISDKQHCPGPCPHSDLRGDKTPNNPSVKVQRGGWIDVNVLANNHRGGFNRWTLVHVGDMYNKQKHTENTFLWSCADVGVSKCPVQTRKRDCYFDNHNDYFKHSIQIPKIYADGVYVLGWVWYGGGKTYGSFGDYYDCVYIKVEGGPFEYAHQPIFKPGPSDTGEHGLCRSTVNQIGVCWKEPCPGGGRPTYLQRPFEFEDGRLPAMIPRSRFQHPYVPKPHGYNSPFVHSMTIRSADYPDHIYVQSTGTRTPHLMLTSAMRVTVTCEVTGDVKYVAFFSNGRKGHVDTKAPYTIAGDWVEYSGTVRYAPWKHNIDRSVTTIACKAYGHDDVEHWENMELSTDFWRVRTRLWDFLFLLDVTRDYVVQPLCSKRLPLRISM